MPESRTARVRVFLPTYRRPTLLPRAIASLQAQTFPDWVCEVHNDDPTDPVPGELLARLGDARFTMVRHQRNIGGTETFNLVFRATREPFYTMLEDDNWWEPEFLATMLAAAQQFPECNIFWSNMRLWKEQDDGCFHDTGRTVHPHSSGDAVRCITWPQPPQIYGAVHSNGAMLVRSQPGTDFPIPSVPFAAAESFRDRSWRYPIVFVPAPLANFSMTRQSQRSDSAAECAMIQTMLAATFLKHARLGAAELVDLWDEARAATPPRTNTLLYASLVEPDCRGLLRFAHAADWGRLLRNMLRRPSVPWTILRSRHIRTEWWNWLDSQTAARFAEARATP
jgi:glycosyltransferase involved in cell wall biosynthesis